MLNILNILEDKYIPLIILCIYILFSIGSWYFYYNKDKIIFEDGYINTKVLYFPTISVTGIEQPEKRIYNISWCLIGVLGIILVYKLYDNPIITDLLGGGGIIDLILKGLYCGAYIALICIIIQGIVTLDINIDVHEITAYVGLFYLIIASTILTYLFYKKNNIDELSLKLKVICIICIWLSWIIYTPLIYFSKLTVDNWWGITQRSVVTWLIAYIATFYYDL
tara:strand:- start:7750 stop:8418 length:669 start_codon:yes stop_codon:yes gene_type:complete